LFPQQDGSRSSRTGRLFRITRYFSQPPYIFKFLESTYTHGLIPILTRRVGRDNVVAYLAILAMNEGKEKEFLGVFGKRIAGMPVSEQMLAWSITGSMEGVVNAARVYAESTERKPWIDAFCQRILGDIESQYQRQVNPETVKQGRAVLDKLNATASKTESTSPSKTQSASAPAEKVRSNRDIQKTGFDALNSGEFEKVAAAFDEAEKSRPKAGYNTYDITSAFMSYALSISKFKAEPDKAVQAALATISGFSRFTTGQSSVPDAVWEFIPQQEDEMTGRGYSSAFGGGNLPGSYEIPESQRKMLVRIPAALIPEAEATVVWGIFTDVRDPKVWEAMKTKADEVIQKLPPDSAFPARVIMAYLYWWSGEYDAAIARMQELPRVKFDPAIRAGISAMLRKQEKWKEASAILDGAVLAYPACDRIIKSWQLTLALEGKDTQRITALARELASKPLDAPWLERMRYRLTQQNLEASDALFTDTRISELMLEENMEPLRQGVSIVEAFPSMQRRDDFTSLIDRLLSDAPRVALSRNGNVADHILYPKRAERLSAIEKEIAGGQINVKAMLNRVVLSDDKELQKASLAKVFEMEPEYYDGCREAMWRSEPGSPERLKYFEAMAGLNPKGAKFDLIAVVSTNSRDREKIVPLAKVVSGIKVHTGYYADYSGGNGWTEIVDVLEGSGELETAAEMLQQAVTLNPRNQNEGRYPQRLVQVLMKLNRNKEAGVVLLDDILPEQFYPTLVAWNTHYWQRNTEHRSQDYAFIKMAVSLGVGDTLRERAEKAGPQKAPKNMLLYLRVLNRDDSVLAEVKSALEKNELRNAESGWLLAMLEEMAEWPKAAEISSQMLKAKIGEGGHLEPKHLLKLAQLAVQNRSSEVAIALFEKNLTNLHGGENVRHVIALLELVVQGDDKNLSEAITKKFAVWLGNYQNDLNELGQLIQIVFSMDETMEGTKALTESINAYADKRERYGSPGQMNFWKNALKIQSALNKGDMSQAAPGIWLDDGTDLKNIGITWDLGSMSYQSQNSKQYAATFMIPRPQLDGKYDVELFFGSSAEVMRPLTKVKKVKANGTWRGAVPSSRGYIRAVFSSQNGILMSNVIPVSKGMNLLTDNAAEAAWSGAYQMNFVKGGPALNGEYHQTRAKENARHSLRGRRIKVAADREYVLSGWVRSQSDSVRLRWEITDEKGNSVQSLNMSDNALNGVWLNCGGVGQPVKFPVRAAYVQVVIEGGSCDVAGFQVREVPQTEEAKAAK